MLRDLSREDAREALVAGIAALIEGRDPLGYPGVAEPYYAAIAQYIAPRIIATARLDLDVFYDEAEAIELVTTELELEATTDIKRLNVGSLPVLPRMVGARDPLGYVIRSATNIPDLSSPKESDRYPGWMFKDVVRKRKLKSLDSLNELADRGVDFETERRGSFDEDGWAAMAARALTLMLPETPVALWEHVTEMVEWSVAALPQVAQSNERNKEYRQYNRVLMASELFSESLSEDQIKAVHNLLWGPADGDGPASSLLVYIARVRQAHQHGGHDRHSALGRQVRDLPHECAGCLMSPLSGDRLRALADTYSNNMARSLSAAA